MVHGQARHDGLNGTARQRDRAHHDIRSQPLGLGHLSEREDVSGHLGRLRGARRLAGTALARGGVCRQQHDAERAQFLLVRQNDYDLEEAVREAEDRR